MSEDLPLVTFALFAYNQESYIREAVNGALAQDYPNLEIIISDDGSTDATWPLILECVDSYRGSHVVRVSRNERNLGIIGHVNRVAMLSSGAIIIMAAGDDISCASRVRECVLSMHSTKAYAVFSAVQKIDSEGVPLGQPAQLWSAHRAVSLDLVVAAGGGLGIGASYAYRKDCFDWPWPLPESLVSEDRLLPLRATLLGGVAYVARPLVQYRVTGQSMTDHLIATGMRAGSRRDHLAELKRTLVFAHENGYIGPGELQQSVQALRSLPMINKVDAKTRRWPPVLRSVALATIGNCLNWRTAPYRLARKFGARGQSQ